MMIMGLTCVTMGLLLWGISNLIYWGTNNMYNTEKMTPFECGFDPMKESRIPFTSRFLLLLILFLVFDIESVIMLPTLNKLYFHWSTWGLTSLLLFLVLLFGGLLYEWYNNVLEWVY
uniref:NADH-ubiquinone oxidoreductase chain 3 n=1 Tax=Mexistrophia reticulata TaxID=1780250 RepID=A0A1W6S4J4_9EUPU|nr:NADH dehydrogenase subunit 3 [Mexistrophia reticulata]